MTLLFALVLALASAEVRFPVVGCEGYLKDEFSRRPMPSRPVDSAKGFRYSDTITANPTVTLETIEAAYRNGLFPWGAFPGNHGNWSHPRERGVLKFCDLKIPRKDRRFIEKTLASDEYVFTENEEFGQIIAACARNFRGTWLTPEMVAAYTDAFEAGHVLADAAWVNAGGGARGELAGAMYGVDIDGNYSGESMRRFRPDVIKVLMYLRIRKLEALGREFMDVQEAIQDDRTPEEKKSDDPFKLSLLVKWGAKPIPRKEYLRMMRAAQERHRSLALGGVRESVRLDRDRTR